VDSRWSLDASARKRRAVSVRHVGMGPGLLRPLGVRATFRRPLVRLRMAMARLRLSRPGFRVEEIWPLVLVLGLLNHFTEIEISSRRGLCPAITACTSGIALHAQAQTPSGTQGMLNHPNGRWQDALHSPIV